MKKQMKIQTLILSKKQFKTKNQAIKWVKDHNFRYDKIDETENSYRFRQFNPEDCQKNSFRTKTLTNGVKVVLCKLKSNKISMPKIKEFTLKTIYVPFKKIDKEKRMVYGYVSTEAEDSDGEIVKKEAVREAWDEYWKFANIREMHQPSAVGVGKEYKHDNKGTWIGAKIVDDNAWKKVKEGVYKGFSIGGKVLEKVKNVIKKIKLIEISLVDRPANPEAVFTMIKRNKNDKLEEINKAVWTRAFINRLPDAAFALILPGGKKDEEGKTTPRSLRKLPHHNMNVKDPNENETVDIPHLRNALARAPQMKGVTEEQRQKAIRHLVRHAKALLPSYKDKESLENILKDPLISKILKSMEEKEIQKKEDVIKKEEETNKEAKEKGKEKVIEKDVKSADKVRLLTNLLTEIELIKEILSERGEEIGYLEDMIKTLKSNIKRELDYKDQKKIGKTEKIENKDAILEKIEGLLSEAVASFNKNVAEVKKEFEEKLLSLEGRLKKIEEQPKADRPKIAGLLQKTIETSGLEEEEKDKLLREFKEVKKEIDKISEEAKTLLENPDPAREERIKTKQEELFRRYSHLKSLLNP